MKLVLTVLLTFLAVKHTNAALDAKAVLEKVKAKYSDKEVFFYTARYEVYKNHQSTEVISNTPSVFYKDHDKFYQQIGEMEMLSDGDRFLQVSKEESILVLSKITKPKEISDLTQIWNECQALEMVENKGRYWITLTLKSFSSVPVHTCVLEVEKKTFSVKSIDLQLSTAIDFSEELQHQDLSFPRLKICLDSFEEHPKKRPDLLDFSRFFIETDAGIKLTEAYLQFELIDNRIN